MSRLRTTSHQLEIETGRYHNIERNLRLCKKCHDGNVEDEFHFLFICSKYDTLRRELLPDDIITTPSLCKLIELMNNSDTSVICKLGKFVYEAMSMF